MNFYSRKMRNTGCALFLLIIIMLYLAVAQNVYSQTRKDITGISRSGGITKTSSPLRLSDKLLFIVDVAENEISAGDIRYTIKRSIRDFSQVFRRDYDMLVQLVICVGILLYGIRIFKKSTYRRASILSLSMGGHAPPIRVRS